MVGSVFEGANDPEFEFSTELAIITEPPNVISTLDLKEPKRYRYVRYKTDTIMGVAEIQFFDNLGQALKGRVIHSNTIELHNAERAFDLDIKTHCSNDDYEIVNNPSSLYEDEIESFTWIGIDFGRPVSIGKIKYLFRHSWNIIENETLYELYYWNNQWELLDVFEGIQNELHCKVPTDAILAIRKLPDQKMEYPFFILNNKQVWGGYEN
jgi:hypothetical protein